MTRQRFTGSRGRYGPEPWVSCPGLFPIPAWGEVTLHPLWVMETAPPNATFGNLFPGPATGPPSSFWSEPWELCFLLERALKWDLIRPPLHKINHRVDVCVVFLAYLLFRGHFSLVIFIQISLWKGPVLYAYPLPLCYHPSSPDLLASSLPPQWKLWVLTTAPLGTSLILAF